MTGKEDSSNAIHLRILVPDNNFQTLMLFHPDDTVWAVKQRLLNSIALKELRDGLNYGLYFPPVNGRAGKFLDEERPLRDYPFTGPIGVLEFKYKKRVYKTTPPDAVKMKKLHSPANMKALMECVQKADPDKISVLTNRGIDPNFIDATTGETPLTMAASLTRPRTVMLALVGGGAILDFRNAQSLTPLHVAVLAGSRDAVITLLDLGASPNYKDRRGLTPLFYSVTRGSQAGPHCVQMLLHDRADFGARDEDGNTELHQACMNGRVQHVEHLVFYGADMNAQNTRGDTPLHMCARYNQEECGRVLLFRGADKHIKNNFHEDAYHVAVVSGHSHLADIIQNFRPEDVVLFHELPTYNEKRRGTISAATLRNLQRSRSNPQLNMLFDAAGGVTHTNVTNGSASLSSAFQYHSNGFLARTSRDDQFESKRDTVYADVEHYQIKNVPKQSSSSARVTMARIVQLQRDQNGFGFILRGAKSRPGFTSALDFVPTDEFPSLQYFDFIEPNSTAARAGLQCGDFLLEVNGTSVVNATHEHAVKMIKNAGNTLTLKVVEGKPLPSVPPTNQPIKHHHQLQQQQLQHQLNPTSFSSVQSVQSHIVNNYSGTAGPEPLQHRSGSNGSTQNNTWARTSAEGLEELERLDATLDSYEQQQQDQFPRYGNTNNNIGYSAASTAVPHSMHVSMVPAVGSAVNKYTTQAELHPPPPPTNKSHPALPVAPTSYHDDDDYIVDVPQPEPEPDYDYDDVRQLPPPPVLPPNSSSEPHRTVNAPIAPPLPASITMPQQYYAAGSDSQRKSSQRQSVANTAESEESKQRNEAHAALMAAVQRRRNLLESVDGSVIADSIESRVQRSKMLQQTVYRASGAENSSPQQVQQNFDNGDNLNDDKKSTPATNSSSSVDFAADAEKARIDYVRKSASSQLAPTSIQMPPKVSSVNGVGKQPPPKPHRPLPQVPPSGAGSNGNKMVGDRQLKCDIFDDLSIMSSGSTGSNGSSGGEQNGGSPSHSSSGDSGYIKSTSVSPCDVVAAANVDQPAALLLPPPAEFASPTAADPAVSFRNHQYAGVRHVTPLPGGQLRTVVKPPTSNSVVFPASSRSRLDGQN